MEKKTNKLIKFLSKPEVLTTVLSTGLLTVTGILCYKSYLNGFNAGAEHMLDVVNSNGPKVIFKACVIGKDIYKKSLCEALPELENKIKNTCVDVHIPPVDVDFIEGTIEFQ